MMSDTMRIIFMGTPDFAVPTLKALVDNGFNVVAVITAPDKPSGRGLKMKATPVKEYAEKQGIPVLQPPKLKNPDFLDTLRSYRADLQVVVAFRMLPELVWNMPPLGTLNLHASLLPDYRGAAPINHAIMQGEKTTGVTTFFLQHEIDTGDIIMQKSIALAEDETAGSLHDKLMELGATVVVETVQAIAEGKVESSPQPPGVATKPAPKIFPEDCIINWDRPATEVERFIRGLSPYPAAKTELDDRQLKVYKGSLSALERTGLPGDWTIEDNHLYFRCADAWLEITDLQAEGKKRMPAADFLRGFRP